MKKYVFIIMMVMFLSTSVTACGNNDTSQVTQEADDWGIGSKTIEEAGGKDYERGQEAIESQKKHQEQLEKEWEEKQNEPGILEKIFSKVKVFFIF